MGWGQHRTSVLFGLCSGILFVVSLWCGTASLAPCWPGPSQPTWWSLLASGCGLPPVNSSSPRYHLGQVYFPSWREDGSFRKWKWKFLVLKQSQFSDCWTGFFSGLGYSEIAWGLVLGLDPGKQKLESGLLATPLSVLIFQIKYMFSTGKEKYCVYARTSVFVCSDDGIKSKICRPFSSRGPVKGSIPIIWGTAGTKEACFLGFFNVKWSVINSPGIPALFQQYTRLGIWLSRAVLACCCSLFYLQTEWWERTCVKERGSRRQTTCTHIPKASNPKKKKCRQNSRITQGVLK